jgi:hypothetical protein
MTAATPHAYQVRAKTQQVKDYHYDETQPGKPLYLLIPGGIIALAALALEIYIAYRSWFVETLDSGTGLALMFLIAPFYIGAVFLFCYGYELYDVGKALRDTAIIVFITLAAVVIIAVLFFLLGGSKSEDKSSSSSSSSKSGSTLGSLFGGSSSSGSRSSSSSNSSGGGSDGLGNIGPIFVDGGTTHTVTHEVVREVPVAPPVPQPIKCPNCGHLYLPAENHFTCPNCGAPTPHEFMPS